MFLYGVTPDVAWGGLRKKEHRGMWVDKRITLCYNQYKNGTKTVLVKGLACNNASYKIDGDFKNMCVFKIKSYHQVLYLFHATPPFKNGFVPFFLSFTQRNSLVNPGGEKTRTQWLSYQCREKTCIGGIDARVFSAFDNHATPRRRRRRA